MTPLTPQNYHIWIKELQGIATKAKVWEYVDPEGTKEEPTEEKFPEVSDYSVLVAAPASGVGLPPATSAYLGPAGTNEEPSEEKISESSTYNMFMAASAPGHGLLPPASAYVDPAETGGEPTEEKFPDVSDHRFFVATPTSGDGLPPTASASKPMTTRPARDYDELSKAQQKSYEMKITIYQMKEKLVEKVTLGIRTVEAAVKASAGAYIPQSKMSSPVRDIIRLLAARYRLSGDEIIEQIHEQFQALKKSPAEDKIEAWVADWESVKDQIEEMNISGFFGSETMFVKEFLRAGCAWAPRFCDRWLDMKLAAEKPITFHEAAKKYRLAVELDEEDS